MPPVEVLRWLLWWLLQTIADKPENSENEVEYTGGINSHVLTQVATMDLSLSAINYNMPWQNLLTSHSRTNKGFK